jgi:hypothetical protein
MTVYPSNLPLTLSRRVTISAARVVTVTSTTVAFMGRVFPARSEDPSTADSAPREALPARVLWYQPGQMVGTINAGDRILDGGVEHEMITSTRGKRAGLHVLVNECACLPVASLYPLTGSLTNQAGTVVQAALPFAVWGASESHGETGDYEELAGECPPEFASVVKRNTQIHAGGVAYRILTASLELMVPRVVFRCRKTERG